MNIVFRYGLGCSWFKGEIWTAGGLFQESPAIPGELLDVVEVLTPFINTWRTGSKLTRRRSFLTMQILDNTLVVFGGGDSDYSLEKLNDEEWRKEALVYQHDGHASVLIPCNVHSIVT